MFGVSSTLALASAVDHRLFVDVRHAVDRAGENIFARFQARFFNGLNRPDHYVNVVGVKTMQMFLPLFSA